QRGELHARRRGIADRHGPRIGDDADAGRRRCDRPERARHQSLRAGREAARMEDVGRAPLLRAEARDRRPVPVDVRLAVRRVALAGDAARIAADTASLLRSRHAAHIDAAMERLRQGGITGNQMPQSGTGPGAPDDFTVKTQSSEALTKGLYTSVAAFVLANMP